MNENLMKALSAALENEAIKMALSNAKSVEEMVSILKENGIDATVEEITALCTSTSGELDEGSLSMVSGGGWFGHVVNFFNGVWAGIKAARR